MTFQVSKWHVFGRAHLYVQEKYDITIQVLGTNTFDFLRKWALSRFFCFWEG